MNVVAAVIEKDGLILICQRKSGRHALKWEFPGGKVEHGETLPEALARELREELAIDALIGKSMGHHVVSYGSGPALHLHFFHVTEFTGEPRNLIFEQILWTPRSTLADFDFLEGDVGFVKALSA